MKVVELLPVGTVTFEGTVAAAGLLLDRVTSAPPVGAEPLSVTMPVEGLPPVKLAGFRDTELSTTVGGPPAPYTA